MNHEILMMITSGMPCRTIVVNGADYLQRYYVGKAPYGGQYWLHRFLVADSEPHLHTHPFNADAKMLTGSYCEASRDLTDGLSGIRYRTVTKGQTNVITPDTLHRIASVEPNTWTFLHVHPGRMLTWKFIADDGSEVVVKSSPENWFENYQPRQ